MPERRADRAEEPAVEIADEDRRDEQHAERRSTSPVVPEQPNIQNGST